MQQWTHYIFIFSFFLFNLHASLPNKYEQEPNNRAVNATIFRGSTTLLGSLKTEDEDYFLWKVSAKESAYSWDIKLFPSTQKDISIEVSRVTFQKAGLSTVGFSKNAKELKSQKQLFRFTNDTKNRAKILSNLLFDKGTYLIRVISTTGKQALEYKIACFKKEKVSASSAQKKKNATKIYLGEKSKVYSSLGDDAWFRFEITEKQSNKIWKIQSSSVMGSEDIITLHKDDKILKTLKFDTYAKATLENLELEKGNYTIHLSKHKTPAEPISLGEGLFGIEPVISTKKSHYVLAVYSTGLQSIDKEEIEPNNNQKEANTFSIAKVVHGSVGDEDKKDFYTFYLPKTYENKFLDIHLQSQGEALHLKLLDEDNALLQEKNIHANYTMESLALTTQKYYTLTVEGGKENTPYSIHFSSPKEHSIYDEVEPNDSVEHASVIDSNISARFLGEELDCYRFNVRESNQFWTLQATGKSLKSLYLYQNTKETLRTREKIEDMLTFKNLFLLRGEYGICVEGKNGNYTFNIQHKDVKEMNLTSFSTFENEPNQDESQANLLTFNQTKQGVLEGKYNEDYFYFTLKNDEHIRLTATPAKNSDIHIRLNASRLTQRAYPNEGEASVIDGIYPPGKYIVNLFTEKPSYEKYTLLLQRLNPFDITDYEPSNSYAQATPLAKTYNIQGHTSSEDEDYYTFPIDTKETNITIRGKNLKNNFKIYPNKIDARVPLKWNEINASYHATLKNPKESYFIVDRDAGYYDYNLSFSNYPSVSIKPLSLTLSLNKTEQNVSSYYPKGQIVDFKLTILSLKDENIHIETHSSDETWKVKSKIKTHILQKGIKKTIPFEVYIPKNVVEDKVIIMLKVANESGSYKSISFSLYATDNTRAKRVFHDWGIEERFLGTLNVAREDLGAKRISSQKEYGEKYPYLFDAITYEGDGFYLQGRREHKDENVTIDLVGENPVEVIGVSLNPKGYNNIYKMLRDFSISLSLDGKDYTKVYEGSLDDRPHEQFFTFDKSHVARYAKLTLHNNHEKDATGEITLGEWKVLAKHESLPKIQGFNIANPRLGGHVVHASKQLSSHWDRDILTESEKVDDHYLEKGSLLSFVLGFKNQRVAKLATMVWKESLKSNPDTQLGDIKIEISTQTPNGPWKEVKQWNRNTTLEHNNRHYSFDSSPWARYIRFSTKVKKSGYYYPPESLEVYEEAINASYPSILSQWGEDNHESYYEYLEYQHKKVSKPLRIIVGNETKEKAYTLENNQTIRGEVSVKKHQKDWYKIVVNKDKNQLVIQLQNQKSVDVTALLYDANHTEINPKNIIKKPLKHSLSFDVKAGTYYLQIKQPPISVIFAWDNSASVSPYEEKIFSSVHHYVNTIEEKIDAVNLLCFNTSNTFLLSNFSDRPKEVQTTLNNFDRKCDSSEAEEALTISSQALSQQEGIKGIILITDADGGRHTSLWSSLKAVNPKVFSIRVASTYDSKTFEGLMQSWSRVNNGTYTVVQNATEMTKAIEQATHILKRPVHYNLQLQSEYVRPLGDGSLTVISQKPKSVQKKRVEKGFGIELILDASGSMLKRIKGKRRIEIAKDVLIKAVQEIIPPKTQVALRVFGHKKADSCRTDLEMRLQSLDVKKSSKIIKRIKAKNLAKTPIAASLAKVATDLKKVKGKRVIILVTDGKETCDGNATAEIEKLKELGVEVKLNIVGFAINDAKLKQEFETWAKLGNGTYFQANDKKSLDEAVKKALQVPYKVYSQEDKLLHQGVVDDEGTKLKGGTYKVIIESYPKQVFEKVIVTGEKQTQLNIHTKENEK